MTTIFLILGALCLITAVVAGGLVRPGGSTTSNEHDNGC
jgi:hypothetical protein